MILRRPSRFIKPCLPSKVARPPSGSFWVHEINRGYRAGAYRGYRYGVGAAAVGAAAVGAAAAVVAATMLRQLGLPTVLSGATPLAYAKEPKACCDGAGDGAVVHVECRQK